MKFTKCDKNFVSEIDQFLAEFDRLHPTPSLSQQYEINKYARVNKLRDHAESEQGNDKLWEGF